MAADLKFFQDRLRERGFRMTSERRAILERIVRLHGHFDADGLLETLRVTGADVSRAPGYRTIGHLVDSGLLRKYDLGDRHTQYEPAIGREHHEHNEKQQSPAVAEESLHGCVFSGGFRGAQYSGSPVSGRYYRRAFQVSNHSIRSSDALETGFAERVGENLVGGTSTIPVLVSRYPGDG